jgi:NADH:ubiquinone oxidoreductase subunit K
MPTTLLLSLSIFLLVIGLTLVLTKQHTIFILIGIELITNGAHLHILTFSNLTGLSLSGHTLVIFSIIVLVCETALALAIILQVYKHYQTTGFPQIKNSL